MSKLIDPTVWRELSAQLKRKYTELTDEDLFYESGKEEETLRRLEQRLGKTGDDLRDILFTLTLRPTGHQP